MKISISNISQKMIHQLIDTSQNARQNGTYLESQFVLNPGPNIILIIFGLLYILLLWTISIWNNYLFVVLSGGVLSFLISRQFQKILRWKKLGYDIVFFDPLYFYAVEKFFINIVPLSEYQYSDKVLSADKKHYLIRFHFNNQTILQNSTPVQDAKTIAFQNILTNYSKLIRQSQESSRIPRTYDSKFKDTISANQFPLIISGFIIILLLFLLPPIIDYNQYKAAKSLNTATSYRIYLAETRNIRHRDEARFNIKTLYDKYITEYSQKAVSSDGVSAFKKVLEYLRDKDLYGMTLSFSSTSLVENTSKFSYKTVPITPSFSSEKNINRQDEVYNTINSVLGKIFPTDIVALANEKNDELPSLRVHYTYKNQLNSYYYSEKEELIPDVLKTFYYGIDIDWDFQLYIPTQKNPLYEFYLSSQPAPKFTSESTSPDAVYNNMAVSAFYDFKNEFNKKFFDWLIE